MHNDFTLFFRKVPSGKKVVYYYAYSREGQRTGPWTTGQMSKTAARNYCNALIRQLKLVPETRSITTFGEYAAGFWDWDVSPYLKDRQKRKDLTRAYADKSKKITKNALIPYFGKMRLDAISSEIIDGWLDTMIEAGYKNSTTNGYFKVLQTMMKWAVRKRIIALDPFLDVQKLIDPRKEKELITLDEFKTLFVDDWKRAWDGDMMVCTANKLSALTGMRCCEVLGLRGEYVYDDHIYSMRPT
jgi:integrase